MKEYCGTDIIEVARVKSAIIETKGFKEKIYSPLEIECAEDKLEVTRYEYYAGRFAAKEAIFKALSKIDNNIIFGEIEVLNDKTNKNRPVVKILRDGVKYMQEIGKLQIDVSISHVKEYAIATCVVIQNNN